MSDQLREPSLTEMTPDELWNAECENFQWELSEFLQQFNTRLSNGDLADEMMHRAGVIILQEDPDDPDVMEKAARLMTGRLRNSTGDIANHLLAEDGLNIGPDHPLFDWAIHHITDGLTARQLGEPE